MKGLKIKNDFFDFDNYKVNLCNNQVCRFHQPSNEAFPSYEECFNYHDVLVDKRRIIKIEKGRFNYSPSFYYESSEPNFPHCANSFEFNYHPLNFKKKECPFQNCNSKFCYFYHGQNEKAAAEKNLNYLKEVKYDNLFSDVIEICSNLLNNLKIGSKEEGKDEHEKEMKSNQNLSLNQITTPINNNTNGTKEIESPSYLIVEKANGYYLNQEVKIFEDHYNEFKQYYKKIESYTRYICAFLNVRGGTLYLGINDQGLVKGIHLTRKKRDEFLLELDQNLKRFTPPVHADECFVSFCPIFVDVKKKKEVNDKYVIEIKVKKSCYNELYFNESGECWVKKLASISLLNPIEIKNYMREKIMKAEKAKINELFDGDNESIENLNIVDRSKAKMKIENILKSFWNNGGE